MVVVHRVFRRELRLIPQLVREVSPGNTARARVLAAHGRLVLRGLEGHHTSEDELTVRAAPDHPPRGLRRRMPDAGAAVVPGVGEHVVAVGQSPFDTSGVEVGADGISRYTAVGGTVVDMLRATVERHAERTAIVELDGPSITYGELWDRALRVAGGLRDAGVRPGDRVAIRLGNGLDWVLAFWGGHLAGAVVVPMNTRLAEPEVEYILGDSGAA